MDSIGLDYEISTPDIIMYVHTHAHTHTHTHKVCIYIAGTVQYFCHLVCVWVSAHFLVDAAKSSFIGHHKEETFFSLRRTYMP